jgi:GMP synthase-like glutamine amidotransferase
VNNPRLLLIQNCAIEGFGLYEQYINEYGFPSLKIHPYRGDYLPDPREYDAVFIGGTPISAYKYREYEFLEREYDFLSDVLAATRPCFGICCGAQILAMLLGAEVKRNTVMEIGSYQSSLTDEGRGNALLNGFPDSFPVFQWHGDTFDIPENTGLLAIGDACRNQLFRKGNVVGLQFHLEAKSEDINTWIDEYAEELANVNKTPDEILSEFKKNASVMKGLARLLMKNFLNDVFKH